VVVVGFVEVYRRYGQTIPFFGTLWSVLVMGWGGEVCSGSHGGGERGCYRCTWSFSNMIVLQSVQLLCIVR
jgi:hypothetical protein